MAGPVIGAVCASNPALYPVWSASREEHLAIVRAHRLAWTLLNLGFFVATVLTAAGLAILAASPGDDSFRDPVLAGVAVTYAIAGGLWCAVLAIRNRTTPALADLVVAGAPTEPAETLLAAATDGMFGAFVLTTGGALVVLGVTLGMAGTVAIAVGLIAALIAALALAHYLLSGDTLPALLYPPTLLIGLGLLFGW